MSCENQFLAIHPNMIIPTRTGIVTVLLRGLILNPPLHRQFGLIFRPFKRAVRYPPTVAKRTTMKSARNYCPTVL